MMSIEYRLLCACNVVYDVGVSAPDQNPLWKEIGWTAEPTWIPDGDRDDGCLIGRIPEGVLVAFRGTEALDDPAVPWKTRLASWCNDFHAGLRDDEPIPGMVHDGYSRTIDSLWSALSVRVAMLLKLDELLYFTGHSKGGALANLAAMRWVLSYQQTPEYSPFAYTFAAPRAGNDVFAREFDRLVTVCQRYEFGNDIVPHLPPHSNLVTLLNAVTDGFLSEYLDLTYQSVGDLLYFDEGGQEMNVTSYRSKLLEAERIVLLSKAVAEGQVNQIIGDHSIKPGSGYYKSVAQTGVIS
jgi:hypothetical protein